MRLHLLRHATFTKRLWIAAAGIALFELTLLIANLLSPASTAVSAKMLGFDCLPFYAVGTFVREGHADWMYDIDRVAAFEQQIGQANGLEVHEGMKGPWWNPPHFALVFVPLSLLSWPAFHATWVSINLACVISASALLMRLLHRARKPRAVVWLVPALVMCSLPFVQAMTHGQNTGLSLLLLSATVTLWRERRGLIAGLVCGLLFYKPQLAALVAAVLVFDMGFAAFVGLACVGILTLVVTRIALPGALEMFLSKLPANLRAMQIDSEYLWHRHVTLKAFWRLLLQGRAAGEPWLMTTLLTRFTLALTAIGLGWQMYRLRRGRRGDVVLIDEPTHRTNRGAAEKLAGVFNRATRFDRVRSLDTQRGVRRDRLIAAAVLAMPLLMPFYFDYDLLLLAIPATLAVITGASRVSRVGWIVLYLVTAINPALSERSGINVATLCVCLLFASHVLSRHITRETTSTARDVSPSSVKRRAA